MRFQKDPDTCGRGLKKCCCVPRIGNFIITKEYHVLRHVQVTGGTKKYQGNFTVILSRFGGFLESAISKILYVFHYSISSDSQVSFKYLTMSIIRE